MNTSCVEKRTRFGSCHIMGAQCDYQRKKNSTTHFLSLRKEFARKKLEERKIEEEHIILPHNMGEK